MLILSDVVKTKFCIGIGSVVKGALQIGYSFVQAECVVRELWNTKESSMMYDELPREAKYYYFPEQLREMLITGIEAGNLKQVKSILKFLNI